MTKSFIKYEPYHNDTPTGRRIRDVIFAVVGDQQTINRGVMGHVSSLKRGRQAGGRLSKKACIPS